MRATRLLTSLAVAFALAAPAAAQMPDVSQMSGVPLPTNDIPNASVSVRVVRGDLSNNVVGLPVELHGGAQVWKATTDNDGRAQFSNLPPGTSVHAIAVVDGQSLESQEFTVPSSGGVRTILVAKGSGTEAGGSPGSAAPASPAAGPPPGAVVFGGQSRFVVELADDAIDVYYLLDVVNASNAPASTEPLVFELPDGARGVSILEGSSSQAKGEGRRVAVTGPFAPGATPVQFAYQVPYSSGDVRISQRLPIPLTATSVAVRKWGAMRVASPQAGAQREITSNNNRQYIIATGGPIAAAGTLDVEITGLPHHAPWPRYLAVALAVLIAAAGAWLSLGDARSQTESRQKRLETRREQLLTEIVRLEEQHRGGRGDDERYRDRREALVAQLEQVYTQLDHAGTVLAPSAAGPAGAGAGA